MRTRLSVLVLLLVAVVAPPAFASRGPDFRLDVNAWDATDVVLVSEGDTIDGKVTVLETWAGSVAAGDELEFPDLARYALEDARTVKWTGSEYDTPLVLVSGARMLLFLFRKAGGALEPVDSWGHFTTSTAWFEGGRAYARRCVMFPGPPELLEHGSETDTKARVLELRRLKEQLRVALQLKDPNERARALLPVMAIGAAGDTALDALVGCGRAAVPVFEELLADPATYRSDDLVPALFEAIGSAAAPILGGVLDRQAARLEHVTRWDEAWVHAEDPEALRRRRAEARRDQALRIVQVLQIAGDPRARPGLERLLLVFKSSRGLHADPDLLQACTAALAATPRSSSAATQAALPRRSRPQESRLERRRRDP